MGKKRRYASVGQECVACGCCEKVCPRDVIKVHLGDAWYFFGRCKKFSGAK